MDERKEDMEARQWKVHPAAAEELPALESKE